MHMLARVPLCIPTRLAFCLITLFDTVAFIISLFNTNVCSQGEPSGQGQCLAYGPKKLFTFRQVYAAYFLLDLDIQAANVGNN